MKIWHNGGATEIAHEKGTFTKQDDGSFDVPEQVFDAVKFAGFSTTNPNPAPEPPAGDKELTLPETLAKLKNKGEVVTFAKDTFGLELDPADKREVLEAAIIAKAAEQPPAGDKE